MTLVESAPTCGLDGGKEDGPPAASAVVEANGFVEDASFADNND